MNPLDKEEFAAFTEIMHKEMPLHTPTNTRIPKSQYSAFPKNLMEYSAKIDNKFLNNHQHIIEECKARDSQNHFIKEFSLYQTKHYDKYGILSHDNFYSTVKKIITSKHRGVWGNMSAVFFLGEHVNGPDLETVSPDSNAAQNGYIVLSRLPAGTVGYFYDRIAIDYQTVAGNNRVAAYQNSVGLPVTLDVESSSVAVIGSFGWISVTEWALVVATEWAGFQHSSASATVKYINGTGPANSRAQVLFTYGAFPNPYTDTGTDSYPNHLKIGHS